MNLLAKKTRVFLSKICKIEIAAESQAKHFKEIKMFTVNHHWLCRCVYSAPVDRTDVCRCGYVCECVCVLGILFFPIGLCSQ